MLACSLGVAIGAKCWAMISEVPVAEATAPRWRSGSSMCQTHQLLNMGRIRAMFEFALDLRSAQQSPQQRGRCVLYALRAENSEASIKPSPICLGQDGPTRLGCEAQTNRCIDRFVRLVLHPRLICREDNSNTYWGRNRSHETGFLQNASTPLPPTSTTMSDAPRSPRICRICLEVR